ncbi:MAG: membrane protein insertion efficiency factor YidD [Phycisphaeraceae bacterium]
MGSRMLGRVVIGLVLAYRATLGQVMSGHCRFHPSCSQYMIDAINKHGPIRGAWRGIRRIIRCHPFGGSGYDPA